MINKLVKSISGVYNKWGSLDTDDKLFYFVIGVGAVYTAIVLVAFIQCLWWLYNN